MKPLAVAWSNEMKKLIYIVLLTSLVFIIAMFNSKTLFDRTLTTWRKYTTAQFEVYGDENVLKDIKITMQIVRQNPYDNKKDNSCNKKMETLFYKGKHFFVDIEHAWYYKIYFSYKDIYVGVLKFENLYQWFHGYINHIYIDFKGKNIRIKYVGIDAADSETDFIDGVNGAIGVDIKTFFEKNNIENKDLKEELKHSFFNFYDPDKSKSSNINCDFENIL